MSTANTEKANKVGDKVKKAGDKTEKVGNKAKGPAIRRSVSWTCTFDLLKAR